MNDLYLCGAKQGLTDYTMRYTTISFLLVTSILFSSCDKIGQNDIPVNEITADKSDGAYYFSDYTEPDSNFFNSDHETSVRIDLDGDLSTEIFLVSTQVTDLDDNLQIKELKIIKNPSYTPAISVVILNPSAPYFLKEFKPGDIIEYSKEFKTQLSGEIVLAREEKNLVTGVSVIEGNWNEAEEKCFIVYFASVGDSFLAWINISVVDYCNVIVHNFASFR